MFLLNKKSLMKLACLGTILVTQMASSDPVKVWCGQFDVRATNHIFNSKQELTYTLTLPSADEYFSDTGGNLKEGKLNQADWFSTRTYTTKCDGTISTAKLSIINRAEGLIVWQGTVYFNAKSNEISAKADIENKTYNTRVVVMGNYDVDFFVEDKQ